MTYEEAIKRLRQETCPATYNKDFDKEACIRVIEERVRKQNEILWILKKYPEWTGSLRSVQYMSDFWKKSGTPVSDRGLYCNDFPFSVGEFKIIVKWLEEERK